MKGVLCLTAALALAACTTRPENVTAAYVSPNMYGNWQCAQLIDEHHRLTAKLQELTQLQRENANADAALMTVGIVVAPVALIGLAATNDRKDELGRVKGEHQAVDM